MTHYWLTFLHVDWPLACFISSLNVWTPFAYMPCPLSHPQMALAESLLLTQNKEDAIRLPGNATTRVHVVSCVVGFPFLNGIVHPCTDITTCRWHYGQDQSPSCEAFQFQKQTNKKKPCWHGMPQASEYKTPRPALAGVHSNCYAFSLGHWCFALPGLHKTVHTLAEFCTQHHRHTGRKVSLYHLAIKNAWYNQVCILPSLSLMLVLMTTPLISGLFVVTLKSTDPHLPAKPLYSATTFCGIVAKLMRNLTSAYGEGTHMHSYAWLQCHRKLSQTVASFLCHLILVGNMAAVLLLLPSQTTIHLLDIPHWSYNKMLFPDSICTICFALPCIEVSPPYVHIIAKAGNMLIFNFVCTLLVHFLILFQILQVNLKLLYSSDVTTTKVALTILWWNICRNCTGRQNGQYLKYRYLKFVFPIPRIFCI